MDEPLTPKIHGVEAAFMVFVCLFFDGVDAVATLLDIYFGAGEFIKIINNAVASVILYFWVTMKDMRPMWMLIGGAVEFIPFANTLPLRTVAMAITIYIDRHPEQTEKVAAGARVIREMKKPKL